jgi:hypothetical protein
MPINLIPQKSLLSLENMSQLAEPVIPDESAYASEIRNPVKVQYDQILSGSRLASAAGGLGQDDELRHSLRIKNPKSTSRDS